MGTSILYGEPLRVLWGTFADLILDPQFYIPRRAFAEGVLSGPEDVEKATIAKLVVGSKCTDRVIIFPSSPSHGPLSGLVRVEFESIG